MESTSETSSYDRELQEPYRLIDFPYQIFTRIATYLDKADLHELRFLTQHTSKIVPLQYARLFHSYRLTTQDTVKQIEANLKQVGLYIRHLVIEASTDYEGAGSEIGDLVLQYCVGVVNLHVKGGNIFNSDKMESLPFFGRLQSLTVSMIRQRPVGKMLKHYIGQCNPAAIVSLTLDNLWECKGDSLLLENIVKLETLVLRDLLDLEVANVYQYLAKNKKLKQFELTDASHTLRPVAIQTLYKNLSSVEHLTIQMDCDPVEPKKKPSTLKMLKYLDMYISREKDLLDIIPVDKQFTKLRLVMSHPLSTQSAQHIATIKTLQSLTLKFYPEAHMPKQKMDEIFDIFKALRKVKHFHLSMNIFNLTSLCANLSGITHLQLSNVQRFSLDAYKIDDLKHLKRLELQILPTDWMHIDDGKASRSVFNVIKANRLEALSIHCATQIAWDNELIGHFRASDALHWFSFRPTVKNTALLDALCVKEFNQFRHLQLLYNTPEEISTSDVIAWMRGAPFLQRLEIGTNIGQVNRRLVSVLQNLFPKVMLIILETKADSEYETHVNVHFGQAAKKQKLVTCQ